MSVNNTKRRRYIRYAIELEATLLVTDSMSVPCAILDFCSGGFFLGFKQPFAELTFTHHKNIKIHFSVISRQGWEDFHLDAEIMHASSQGIGVAVENMPVSAFNALKNEANNGSKAISFDRRSTSSDKLNQDSCKKVIRKMLDEQLPPLLARFFECFGNELIKANEHSPDFKNQSELDDLITTIKLNRESITSEFCSSILAEVNHISDCKPKMDVDTVTDGKTLALIEKEDFEDWLNLSSIIRKLTNFYKNRIHQIEEKLSLVFGCPAHAIKNPVSPGIICDSFREIILQFNLNNPVKQTLYTIFEGLLTSHLSPLFDQFDRALANFGVPEQIAPRIIRQPDKSHNEIRYREQHKPANEHRSQPGQQASLISNDDLFNLLQIAEQKNAQPVTQVTRKLLDILKDTKTLSAEEVYDDKAATKRDLLNQAQAVFTADEVIAAIAKIQQNTHKHSNLHYNSMALQKLLQDTLENSSAKQKTISTSDIKQLEVYGKLFETLFNDLKVSSEIKSYIENIHLTLLSLSLQGNNFLDSESHPARKVLNQLAALESAVKGNKIIKKTNIKQVLDKLVSRIAEESGTNPNIFAEVEQELNEITEQVTKSVDLNIRRMVETYEGQQKLETARRLVQREIDSRIAGKIIPKIISVLLTSGWQHLLVITELNKEKSQDENSKFYQVIDDLILWLSGRNLILEEQSDRVLKTLEFVEDQLSSVCTNAFIHDSIIEELTALLIGIGTPRVRKEVEMMAIEPVSIKDKASVQVSDDNWLLQVEQLRVGEWLTIFRNAEGFEPMKLVWIGDLLPIYVFVDRDGLNKLEFTKGELAELLQHGGANRTENLDAPLMDRATNTMLQKMYEKLIYNAIHDPVTGLYTRDEFVKRLKHEMATIGNSVHMLCHIEIQDFRMITNICGVEGGNQLLKKITHTLTGRLRNEEIFARLGDKAFGVLFKQCSTEEGFDVAKKIVNLIGESHFVWDDKSYPVAVNVGLTPFVVKGYDVYKLLQQADFACISSKQSGHNHIQLFEDDDDSIKRQKKIHEWAGQIDRVLSENRLFIRCQKIVPVEPNKSNHIHYEILLGIRDNIGNLVPPDHFIPAAERCHRMPEIDQWIVRHVFDWIEQNRNYFDQMGGFSINLSGQSINTEAFLVLLKDLLASSNVPHQKLTFEITETVAADSLVYVKKFIKQIKQFGCKFSLDDFGSGYSSYTYLKSLNVDYLKIDGTFVKDISTNKADAAIVKSMNEIAHSLGMETIAEYVENNDILNILRQIGVDYAQGYGIQKPILLTELKNESRFAEDNGIVEDHSVVEDKSFSEENGLAEDNEFWGF